MASHDEAWTKAHRNCLSKREMEALTAVCDTLLPRIDVPAGGCDDALASFYGTSASMAGTPELIGGLLSGGLQHPSVGLLRLALWLLSTRLGTLGMCGRASMSSRFPYLQRWSDVRQEMREEIMLGWSLSSFHLYRMLFKCLKYLTMRLFFVQVKEERENPSWKALGYCGPDPSLVQHSESEAHQHGRRAVGTTEDHCSVWGPLHAAVLPLPRSIRLDHDQLFQRLHKAGFPSAAIRRASPPLPILRCDAVVVGSGSGGSVVAGVLATAGYKVLVLEKGNYYARRGLSLLEGPSSAAMYEGGGMIATDDVGVLLLAGSTVGGGSTINWSASIRTPDHVRKEWCDEHGLELFGSEAYDHALDVVCDRMGVQSVVNEEGFNSSVLRRGCLKLGFPVIDVPCNAPPDHYCGWCHLGCKDGKKKSTQETWLSDVAGSGNGLILTGCRALKVLHEKRGWTDRSAATGVVVESGNKEVFVVESRVTVIACGALNTPGLLKRSGLRNGNIGRHLHLHPTVMAWGYFPAAEGGWPEEGKRSYEGGILTAMSTVVSEPDAAGYGAILQTPALHPGMFSALMPWVSARDFRERMTRFSRTAHMFALARDRGSGTVDYPGTVAYRLDSRDERSLRKGLEAMLRILAAAGAEEVGTQHGEGDRLRVQDGRGHRGLEDFVRGASGKGVGTAPMSSAHQMGSCRMGTDPAASAVGPSGETWEVEGLFVADASVFPTALGVNPMVTVQAIAYCTADSILHRLRTEL